MKSIDATILLVMFGVFCVVASLCVYAFTTVRDFKDEHYECPEGTSLVHNYDGDVFCAVSPTKVPNVRKP